MAERTPEGLDEVWDDWHDAVNLTPKELEDRLDTDESRSVGDTGGEGAESTGHAAGRRIVQILRTKKADLGDDDVAHMRKVVGSVHRHAKRGGPERDNERSRWRYSLMKLGQRPAQMSGSGPQPRTARQAENLDVFGIEVTSDDLGELAQLAGTDGEHRDPAVEEEM